MLQFRTMSWLPASIKAAINPIREMAGRADVQVSVNNLTKPTQRSAPMIDVRVQDMHMVHGGVSLPVRIKTAQVTIHDLAGTSFSASGSIGKSRIDVRGTGRPDQGSLYASITGTIHVAELGSLIDPDHRTVFQRSGWLRPSLVLDVSSDLSRLEGQIELEDVSLETAAFTLSPPVSPTSVELSFQRKADGALRFDKLLLQLQDQSLLIATDWFTWPHPPARFRAETGHLDMERLGLKFRKMTIPVSGGLRLDIDAALVDTPPFFRHAVGSVAIDGFNGMPFSSCQQIGMGTVVLKFDGNRAEIQGTRFNLEGDSLVFSGNIESLDPIRGNIRVDAGLLHVFRLLDAWKCLQTLDDSAKWLPDSLNIAIHANVFQGKTMSFGPLDASFSILRNGLVLNEAKLQAPSGYLRLKGYRAMNPDRQYAVGYLQLKQQDCETLLQELRIEPARVTGAASIDGWFHLDSSTHLPWTRGFDAEAAVTLEKGHLLGSNPFLTIFSLLSVQNLIRLKTPELVTDRFPFDLITADMIVEKGELSLPNLRLDGPVFNATASGTLNLENKNLQADIGVHPLGALDEIVRKIPYLGHVLTGDDKTIWEYHFSATGVFPNNIDVRYQPLQKIPGGILGTIQRSLALPKAIFLSIFGEKPEEPHMQSGKSEREIRYEQDQLEGMP
jgi:hypothetical protein